MFEEPKVGAHVEGHAVQRAVVRHAHPDGGDLARPLPRPGDPDTRIVIQSGGAGQPEVRECVDDHLLDGPHVGRRVRLVTGAPPGQGEYRIGRELTRTVERDVPAPVGTHQFGADRRRVHKHVGRVGANTHGVGRLVLLTQQPIVGATQSERVLQRVGVAVLGATQPADV